MAGSSNNQSEAGELKACPFCGNPSLVLFNLGEGDDWGAVRDICPAQMIISESRAQAVADWNRRP